MIKKMYPEQVFEHIKHQEEWPLTKKSKVKRLYLDYLSLMSLRSFGINSFIDALAGGKEQLKELGIQV
jgi:hypothetical protein